MPTVRVTPLPVSAMATEATNKGTSEVSPQCKGEGIPLKSEEITAESPPLHRSQHCQATQQHNEEELINEEEGKNNNCPASLQPVQKSMRMQKKNGATGEDMDDRINKLGAEKVGVNRKRRGGGGAWQGGGQSKAIKSAQEAWGRAKKKVSNLLTQAKELENEVTEYEEHSAMLEERIETYKDELKSLRKENKVFVHSSGQLISRVPLS